MSDQTALLPDIKRALEMKFGEEHERYFRAIDGALQDVKPQVIHEQDKPPRNPLQQTAMVIALANRIEQRLPGGPRCTWIGETDAREPRGKIVFDRIALPARDRERNIGLIAGVELALKAAYPERAKAILAALRPRLAEWFITGNLPMITDLARPEDLPAYLPALLNQRERWESRVHRWWLYNGPNGGAPVWTLSVEVGAPCRPEPLVMERE